MNGNLGLAPAGGPRDAVGAWGKDAGGAAGGSSRQREFGWGPKEKLCACRGGGVPERMPGRVGTACENGGDRGTVPRQKGAAGSR